MAITLDYVDTALGEIAPFSFGLIIPDLRETTHASQHDRFAGRHHGCFVAGILGSSTIVDVQVVVTLP